MKLRGCLDDRIANNTTDIKLGAGDVVEWVQASDNVVGVATSSGRNTVRKRFCRQNATFLVTRTHEHLLVIQAIAASSIRTPYRTAIAETNVVTVARNDACDLYFEDVPVTAR